MVCAPVEKSGRGAGPVTDADGGWQPVGPSAEAYPGLREDVRALRADEIQDVVAGFAAAAVRAADTRTRATLYRALGHAFDFALGEVRKIGAKLLHQLGTDHRYPAMENRPRPLEGPLVLRLSGNFVSRKKDLPRIYAGAP